jgi:hypothetical protein
MQHRDALDWPVEIQHRHRCCVEAIAGGNSSRVGEKKTTAWRLRGDAKLEPAVGCDDSVVEAIATNATKWRDRCERARLVGRRVLLEDKMRSPCCRGTGTAEAIPGNGQSLGNGDASVCLGRSNVDDNQVVVMDAMMGRSDGDGVGWKSMGRGVIART